MCDQTCAAGRGGGEIYSTVFLSLLVELGLVNEECLSASIKAAHAWLHRLPMKFLTLLRLLHCHPLIVAVSDQHDLPPV